METDFLMRIIQFASSRLLYLASRANSALRAAFAGYPKMILSVLAAIVFAGITTIAVGAWIRPDKTSVTGSWIPAPSQSPTKRLEAEIITLTYHGFEPKEIKRPQGQFLLVVDNRLGVTAAQFRLDREAGSKVDEKQVAKGQRGWNRVIDLPPGRYRLTEFSRRDWSCQITITEK